MRTISSSSGEKGVRANGISLEKGKPNALLKGHRKQGAARSQTFLENRITTGTDMIFMSEEGRVDVKPPRCIFCRPSGHNAT